MPDLGEMTDVLKAASESTRLRILALMAEGELSVKDITEILEQSQPRVSRHLKLLAEAGLAQRYAEGAWAYYGLIEGSLQAELARSLVHLLDSADPVLGEDKRRLQKVREGHATDAAAYFATVAESWDTQRSLHVPESAVEAGILAVASRRKFERVLDLGTGTGRMLELLADHYQHGVGVDASREMISVARSKLSSAQIKHAQVRLADIGDPMDMLGSADLVILHQVLHYFDDPGRVLVQAAAALTPDGEVLVVDFAPHEHEFLRTEHAHRRLGLSDTQVAGWARLSDLDVLEKQTFPNPDDPNGLTVCLWVLGAKQHISDGKE